MPSDLGHHSLPASGADQKDGPNGQPTLGDCAICHLSSVQPQFVAAVTLFPVVRSTRYEERFVLFVSQSAVNPDVPIGRRLPNRRSPVSLLRS